MIFYFNYLWVIFVLFDVDSLLVTKKSNADDYPWIWGVAHNDKTTTTETISISSIPHIEKTTKQSTAKIENNELNDSTTIKATDTSSINNENNNISDGYNNNNNGVNNNDTTTELNESKADVNPVEGNETNSACPIMNINLENKMEEIISSDFCAPPTMMKITENFKGRLSHSKCLEFSLEKASRIQKTLHDICKYRGKQIRKNQLTKLENEEKDQSINDNIVDVKSGDFPHLGAIGWWTVSHNWIFKCTGSLISSRFVLTSAQCTTDPMLDGIVARTYPEIVRLGNSNINDYSNPQIDARILRTIPHNAFDAKTKDHNIALIELINDVNFNYLVQPACVGIIGSYVESNMSVTGWDIVDTDDLYVPADLIVSRVKSINREDCDRLMLSKCMEPWCLLNDTEICVTSLDHKYCQDIIGSPLQANSINPELEGQMYHITGVKSFDISCHSPTSPSVFTNVINYIDWIENVVWG